MPGPQGAAEPGRFVLLGLLLSDAAHGYDLARSFAPGSALGEVVHLGPSHLYALLNRLERDGLIAGEREIAGAHPPRRVYHITGAGREAVLRWIDEPVEHPREMRIDFPLKFYLGNKIDPARAAALVERQHRLFASYIDQLERHPVSQGDSGVDAAGDPKRHPEGDPEGALEDVSFIALMRDGRIGRLRAALRWLEQCVEPQPPTSTQMTG